MPRYGRPGVYTGEVNISQAPTGVAPGVCAAVGAALRGPHTEPVLLTDTRDATTIFGNPDPSGTHGYALHSALMALTVSNRVWFRRVVGPEAEPARVLFRPDPTDEDGLVVDQGTETREVNDPGALELSAANPGEWGNNLLVEFDNYDAEASTVEINVYERENGVNIQRENHVVSFSPDAVSPVGNLSLYVEDVINENSRLIRANHNANLFRPGTHVIWPTGNQPGADAELTIEDVSERFPTTGPYTLSIRHDTDQPRTLALTAEEPDADGFVSLDSADPVEVDGNNVYLRMPFRVNSLTGAVVGPLFNGDMPGASGTEMRLPTDVSVALTYTQRVSFNFASVGGEFVQTDFRNPIQLAAGVDDAPSAAQITAAWGDFEERDRRVVTHLIQGGSISSDLEDVKALQTRMTSIAERRRDCFAILDPPPTALAATDLVEWVNGADGPGRSSFAQVHGPQQRINDSLSNRRYDIPLSGSVAAIHAFTHRSRRAWFAPAGETRGRIPSGHLQFLRLSHDYSEGELEALHAAGVNPFETLPGTGTVLMGQHTRLRDGSALSRINVRYLVIETENAMRRYLRNAIFEQNTVERRMEISGTLDAYFRGVQSGEGVVAFQVRCDDSNNTPATIDAGELHVDVWIQPTRAIEFIVYNTVITRTGVDLQQLVSTSAP